MIKQVFTQKSTGDALSASEWNSLTSYVNTAVDEINNGSNTIEVSNITDATNAKADPKAAVYVSTNIDGVGTPAILELTGKGDKGTNITVCGNNNINIEPREAIGTGDGKNKANDTNRKGGNIALKPGDDIELWAHHRGSSKNDEVSVKVLTEDANGEEVPAKLLLNTSDIVITSKDKTSDTNITNITFNKAKNSRGYLKVRAQAIDLRCEDHGGIAIQPKGRDGQGHMNKIKFEHGGGDGLEFGTFNTEHTSLFTEDYRFNKDGVIRLATRVTEASNKADVNDDTTALKYVKQGDDLYDVIDATDPTCTWEDVVKYISWAKINKQGPFAAN